MSSTDLNISDRFFSTHFVLHKSWKQDASSLSGTSRGSDLRIS